MIGRVDDRRVLDRLRASDRQIRRRTMTVAYVAVPGLQVPAVAFAIGRRFGNAVQRNRARRRLRAAFETAARSFDTPPAFAFLVRARPAVLHAEFARLVEEAEDILRTEATESAPAR